MFGVCPKCRTAYHWDVPRYGCQCGHISDTPPAENLSPQYTSLGRSPWNGGGMWRDADPGNAPRRPATRPPGGAPVRDEVISPALAQERDRERERLRDQRRQERADENAARGEPGRGRGRGGRGNQGGRRGRSR